MGYVFQRGAKLWVGYDHDGKRVQKPTGLNVGEEAKARAVLRKIETKLVAGEEFGADGPITVEVYAERWLKERKARGLAMADDDEARMYLHVIPRIGEMVLADVRVRHIRDFVRAIRSENAPMRDKPLAPRTVRHVYMMLHSMFREAVVDELLDVNPCVLKTGDLPKKIDSNPQWRAGAVFTHEEVAALISDARIDEDRRVFYGLLAVAGLRDGEAAALTWRAIDVTQKPLHRLVIGQAFNSKLGVIKSVKTETPRWVPVHPALAALLKTWRETGWKTFTGKEPKPDDLVVPRQSDLKPRRNNKIWAALQADIETLGFRSRRAHDLRRTLVSLWREDGGREDLVKLVTHGPPRDIMDLYTTIGWPTLCAEMLKLRVGGTKQTALVEKVLDEGRLQSAYSAANPAKAATYLDAGAGLEPAAFGL